MSSQIFKVECRRVKKIQNKAVLEIEAQSYEEACELARAIFAECDPTGDGPALLGSGWEPGKEQKTSLRVPGSLKKARELKRLPLQTAKVLAAHSLSTELALSDLIELTPESARALAEFRGQKLLLTGLKDLSVEVARELAKFPGEVVAFLRVVSSEAAECFCAAGSTSNITSCLHHLTETTARLALQEHNANPNGYRRSERINSIIDKGLK
jgi:hypothetical protein